MTFENIEKDFIEKFSSKIRIVPDGKERFRVFTPFRFDDGDHLAIVLKNESGQWVLSDEGHTYMHLTYELDEKKLHSGTHHKIISGALSMFEVKDRNGELILEVQGKDYGTALYAFAQSLLRIGDVSYVSLFRERRRKQIFRKYVQGFLEKNLPVGRMTPSWAHPNLDPDRKYKVDCKINGTSKPPLLVYALSSDANMHAATIALHKFKSWNLEFTSLGILEDPTPKTQRALEWFLDIGDACCDLTEGNERIQEYIA